MKTRAAHARLILLASLISVPLSGSVAIGADSAAPAQRSTAGDAPSRTIGLALTSWRHAFVETPDYQECGGKLDPGPVAQLRATPGAIERIKREGGTFENAGPNGETPQQSPLIFNDPLPVPETITKIGFGDNLDGTVDGAATSKSCKHEKFTNDQGTHVDHQMARVLGCVQGYRTGGQTAEFYSNEIVGSQINRHLIEISGVDDEANDPAVQVDIYKGYDRLVRASDNRFVPFLSQRIDTRYPKYHLRTRGRIENGTLITEPIPEAVFPISTQSNVSDRNMRDMRLRLKLTPEGAAGLLSGYDNWRQVWNLHSKKVTAELNKMSSPTIYRRFLRYADGYPDPKTGQCGFISSAYKVTAVRAIIVHPEPPGRPRIARAGN